MAEAVEKLRPEAVLLYPREQTLGFLVKIEIPLGKIEWQVV